MNDSSNKMSDQALPVLWKRELYAEYPLTDWLVINLIDCLSVEYTHKGTRQKKLQILFSIPDDVFVVITVID